MTLNKWTACAALGTLAVFLGASLQAAGPVLTVGPTSIAQASVPDHGLLRPPDEVLTTAKASLNAQALPVPVQILPDAPALGATTDGGICMFRGFEVPFAPQAAAVKPGENEALAAALQQYKLVPGDVTPLLRFLDSYPGSRWEASILLNVGLVYYNQARWSKAIPAWERAWLVGKDEKSEKMHSIADRTVGELAQIHARLGHYERLQQILEETKSRDIRGAGTQRVFGAKEGLWMMLNQPGEAFRCGPLALAHLYALARPGEPVPEKISGYKSTIAGTSLADVSRWSKELGLRYQAAYRNPGADLIVPSVIHWKVGHFAALSRSRDGNYLSQDSTFDSNHVVTPEAIDSEASGYFLIPEGNLPVGWRAVADDEARRIFGKGYAGLPGESPPPCEETAVGGGSSTCTQCASGGMTTYTFDAASVSLLLVDSPVGYTPPVGPEVRFTAHYNHREQAGIGVTSTLGNKWSFNWISYLQTPTSGTVCFGPGGGELAFTQNSNGTFQPQLLSHDQLVQTSTTSYVLTHPDGSQEIYNLLAYGFSVLRTQSIDRNGNAITYGYDSYYRLISVTDALGQVTTLQYDSTDGPNADTYYAVRKVIDPFGRTATFGYNSSLQLTSITDTLGIVSSYAYGANDFITGLTTPYGTTTFSCGDTQNLSYQRWVQAKDPLGGQERIESDVFLSPPFADVQSSFACTQVPGSVAGSGFTNTNLVYRNSFFWSKKAMLEGAGDYSKAKIYHWLHQFVGANTFMSFVPESTRNHWKKVS